MERPCIRAACPSCCGEVAILFQKRCLGFLSGNLGQPPADRAGAGCCANCWRDLRNPGYWESKCLWLPLC